ncbi:MAG: hypothetical protein VYE73_15480 [Acidobacteriota bacterium]|nr:hypothetical protein [Acidobacteriota bacterium]
MKSTDSTPRVFDPRGVVSARPQRPALRRSSLAGAKVAILDNSKWNAGQLLRNVAVELERGAAIGEMRYYTKESFSRVATPEMVAEIVRDNDVVLTAIGD